MRKRGGLNFILISTISTLVVCLGVFAARSASGKALTNNIRGVQTPTRNNLKQRSDANRDKRQPAPRLDQASSQAPSQASSQAQDTDPARIAGHDKCVDCHQSEIKSWLASKHSSRAFDMLRTSESSFEYADKLDIRVDDIAKSSICANCHGTPQIQLDGSVGIIPGVSCESCHNGASGDSGWLNSHAVYGSLGTAREQETPAHYANRQQRCQDAGQLRSSNLYGLAKRCFQCHVVGNEALSIAGHDHGEGFELVANSLGEIRHNFVLNENENAKIATLWTDPFRHGKQRTVAGRIRVMLVLGQMIDLEISFRNLASATGENDFSFAMIERIGDAYELLAEDILEDVADAELNDEARSVLADIAAVVEIVKPVWESLDDVGFAASGAPQYVAVADAVAAFATKFSQRDGNQLAFLDQLDLLPEDVFDGAFDPVEPNNSNR